MKNGVEIRPNGVKITKFLGKSMTHYMYRVQGSMNGPWDYLRNARMDADSMIKGK